MTTVEDDARIPDPGEPWTDGGLFWTVQPIDKQRIMQAASFIGDGPAGRLVIATPFLDLPVARPNAVYDFVDNPHTGWMMNPMAWLPDVIAARGLHEWAGIYQWRILETLWGAGLVQPDGDHHWMSTPLTVDDPAETYLWLADRWTTPIPDQAAHIRAQIADLVRRVWPKGYDRTGRIDAAIPSFWETFDGCMVIHALNGVDADTMARTYGDRWDNPDPSEQGMRRWAWDRLDRVATMFDTLATLRLESPNLADTFRRKWMKGGAR